MMTKVEKCDMILYIFWSAMKIKFKDFPNEWRHTIIFCRTLTDKQIDMFFYDAPIDIMEAIKQFNLPFTEEIKKELFLKIMQPSTL